MHMGLKSFWIHTWGLSMTWQQGAFPPFWHLRFWQESSRHGCFIMRTFWEVHCWPCQRSGRWTRECFNMETFWHKKFLAQGISAPWTFQHGIFWHLKAHFGTWIFWHLLEQYGCFGTDIWAPVLLCQNVHVPKYPCAKMFLCRKIKNDAQFLTACL